MALRCDLDSRPHLRHVGPKLAVGLTIQQPPSDLLHDHYPSSSPCQSRTVLFRLGVRVGLCERPNTTKSLAAISPSSFQVSDLALAL